MRSLLTLSLTLLLCAACPGGEGGGGGGLPGEDGGLPDGSAVTDGGALPDGGAEDGGGDAGEPLPLLPHLAEDLAITSVEIFQTLQIPLMIQGVPAAPTGVPLIADRESVMRIWVEPQAGWVAGPVTLELEVGPPGSTIEPLSLTLGVDRALPFDLTVPAEQLGLDAHYALRLLTETGTPTEAGVDHPGRHPRDGSSLPLPTERDEGGVDLVLVPLRYQADGSGRLPDTSPEQLAIIEELLLALYPIESVSIDVHAPIDWSDPLTLFTRNFDFGDLNTYLKDLKIAEGAPSTTYYYALVQPAATFADYCGRSCTTGQAFAVTDPENGNYRVGGGMGYSGERWAWTLVHELGHMHGRFHAPCGVDSWDADYPHAGGTLGVWGYDRRRDVFLDPALYADMMGYCDDQWISDYTYEALFERILTLSTLKSRKGAPLTKGAAAVCRSGLGEGGPTCVCD
ncbi:MAG: M66 family metalloprotease [Deltaproteobacteria bacterium]|nr:M66 family metalloprotease [Deltaproteobacteria bacterium]